MSAEDIIKQLQNSGTKVSYVGSGDKINISLNEETGEYETDIDAASQNITEPIDFPPFKSEEEFILYVETHLTSLKIADLKQSLSAALLQQAEQQSKNMLNIAAFNDYARFMREPEEILPFLQQEAHKPNNWQFKRMVKVNAPSLSSYLLYFSNIAIDDGNYFSGYVVIEASKIPTTNKGPLHVYFQITDPATFAIITDSNPLH